MHNVTQDTIRRVRQQVNEYGASWVDTKLQEMSDEGQKVLAYTITDAALALTEAMRELFIEQLQGGAQQDAEEQFNIDYELDEKAVIKLAVSQIQQIFYDNIVNTGVCVYESLKQQETINELEEQWKLQ